MGLMSSIVSAGSVILQYGINGLGTLTIAGHTAARKLFAFTDMPLIAMANAASTFVSQNYGAVQPERIRKGKRYLEKPSERNAVVEEMPIRRDSGFPKRFFRLYFLPLFAIRGQLRLYALHTAILLFCCPPLADKTFRDFAQCPSAVNKNKSSSLLSKEDDLQNSHVFSA